MYTLEVLSFVYKFQSLFEVIKYAQHILRQLSREVYYVSDSILELGQNDSMKSIKSSLFLFGFLERPQKAYGHTKWLSNANSNKLYLPLKTTTNPHQ